MLSPSQLSFQMVFSFENQQRHPWPPLNTSPASQGRDQVSNIGQTFQPFTSVPTTAQNGLKD